MIELTLLRTGLIDLPRSTFFPEGGPEIIRIPVWSALLRTSDGIVLFRLPGAMPLQPGELGETIRADHVLNVSNLNFDRPGRYAFDVLVDGQVAATVPLRVEEMPARH